MNHTDLFEEMLATYPAEKRELARQVYHRFADGDSTQFFTQLLLVLDVYARYVEHIPKAAVEANRESFAILEDMREEIGMIAKTIETRDLNITNHAAKTDELCKITQAKCNETIASVELMVKNLGSQIDTKAIVLGVQAALDKGIKAEVIAPFLKHSKELGELVVPSLKQIKEASSEAHTLWRSHIWKTAWAGSLLASFTFFILALVAIGRWEDRRDQRALASEINQMSLLLDYNQEAFQQLAVARIPVRVVRTGNDGAVSPQGFAVVVQDAGTTEMRDEDGHHNGFVFVTSNQPEEQIQSLQKEIDKLTQTAKSSAK